MKSKTKIKLECELVPSTCWVSNVRSCVTEPTWDLLRKACYAEAGHKCEICGGRGPAHPVECHEVWSYTERTKVQKLERLIALCPLCHEVKHIGLAQLNGREKIAMAHLIVVNEWGMDELKAHLKQIGEDYERRSRLQWKLDLSLLDRLGVTYKLDRPDGARAAPKPKAKAPAKAKGFAKKSAVRKSRSAARNA